MNESVTFGGVDTLADLGLRILQDVETPPPEVKDVTVDIPGGDGSIDLSEFSGDVRYSDREMSIPVLLASSGSEALEREKTQLLRTFHGQRADFTLSWDPGFTYTGRMSVGDFERYGARATAVLSIVADPYKHGGTETWRVNAAGGVAVVIPCGRRRWCPAFQVERETLVSFEGTGWRIPAGTHRITDLYLRPGDNVLVINTDPDYGTATWNDYAGQTWAQLHEAHRRWCDVAAGDSPRQVSLTWADLAGTTWADHATKRWVELVHDSDEDPTYTAYIQTERYEL